MTAPAAVAGLLANLEAVGVHLSLTPAGDGLALTGKGRPPAELLDEVRRRKPELLEVLKSSPAKKEAEQPTPSPDNDPPDVWAAEGVPGLDNLSAPSAASLADPLPAHLAALIDAAHAGQLPRGAVKLSSGLVTDLEVYVIAWAVGWPSDRAHRLRRLEEAHAAWVRP